MTLENLLRIGKLKAHAADEGANALKTPGA